ncbi:MAG: cob(I)yrinic acid a,c-diamide adenosyltransferase [Deltaproteobacteria bacterium]|nr:cob(I)yrinic acid a,c-diamide adenosyltransferase [Deltaproteobacteria bacterium]
MQQRDSNPGKRFEAPRIAINRVYTRRGDTGMTSLVGGQRVSKRDLRIDSYGTLDELNAFIGAARESLVDAAGSAPRLAELGPVFVKVQHELFNAGSILATLPEDVHPMQPRITAADVDFLEADMDLRNADLETLRSFVLPGGSRLNTDLHVARTVCRRAERTCVALSNESEVDPLVIAYLNRLSDALFVWSRWACHVAGVPETLWDPNKGS